MNSALQRAEMNIAQVLIGQPICHTKLHVRMCFFNGNDVLAKVFSDVCTMVVSLLVDESILADSGFNKYIYIVLFLISLNLGCNFICRHFTFIYIYIIYLLFLYIHQLMILSRAFVWESKLPR